MKRLLSSLLVLMVALAVNAQNRKWDFTKWSEATVTNLKADAALSKTEGWSDVEKKADAEAGADPTELSKDNCFWFQGTVNEDGSINANEVPIAELAGLKFDATYGTKRSLAIAVNYQVIDTSKDFGPYAGPAYLWLGGKNSDCFTIPNVSQNTCIAIAAESHKVTDARGIELYAVVGGDVANATKIGDSFTPKTQETKIWVYEGEDCDILVKNTNGCHIYAIELFADIDVQPESGLDLSTIADLIDQRNDVRDVIITLDQGGSYTFSKPIKACGTFTINGNGATIDASGLATAEGANAMFERSGDAPAEWAVSSFVMKDVTVKGLSKGVFYSAVKNYFYSQFTIDNCVIELAADVMAIDFTKGSAAGLVNITNSTIYAPTASTKSLYSSQGGQKATEYNGDQTQTFNITNNTMYNLTKAKNFFSHRQSNQKWLAYNVENNVFVNCGKSGQTIKGMNGGQGSANPTWAVTGNAFNFEDADTSANEDNGDADEPVQNSVAGVVAFTDAAAGDFNGTFALAAGIAAPASLGDPRWTLNFVESGPAPLLVLKGTVGEEISIKPGVYDEFDIFSVDFGDGTLVTDSVGHFNKGVCVDDGNDPSVWPQKEGTTHTGITEFKGTVAGDGTVTVYSELKNSDIWYLSVSGGIPSSFDQEKLKKVVQMTVSKVAVDAIDLKGLDDLKIFGFSQGSLKSINVKENAALTNLTINNNSASTYNSVLESIDLSGNANLEQLNLMAASATNPGILATLDLTSNPMLKNVYAQYNSLTSVKLPAGAALSFLNLQDNQLESIDLTVVESFKDTYLNNNKLTTVDLSKLTAGANLYLDGNQLTEVNVPVSVKNLQLNDNKLTQVTLVDATASCKLENNQLTLATIPAQPASLNTSKKAQKFTYAPQAALAVAETLSEIDLSAQATVAKGELNPDGYADWLTGATTFSFVDEDGTALVSGTDYEETASGKFKFLKTQSKKIHGVMLNTALPKFTEAAPFVTTEFTVSDAVGISDIRGTEAAGKIFNLQGIEVKKAGKGLFIIDGKKVVK